MLRIRFIIFFIIAIIFFFTSPIESKNFGKKEKNRLMVKEIKIDNDMLKDTVSIICHNQNKILINTIRWGKDSSSEYKITKIEYPDVKIEKANYIITKINYDNTPDIVINLEYFDKKDTLNRNLISRQIIIYTDSRVKEMPKIFLAQIKKFQRNPILAQSERENYLTTPLQYLRYNKSIFKEIKRINTDLLEEEQEIVQDVKNTREEPSFQIFPNPAKNSLYIKGKNYKTATYTIVDLTGNKVLKGELINSRATEIDISNLLNGVYTVIIANSQKVLYTQKIIISK